MFNLGMSEIVIIAVIALIFIGPEQIPDLARSIAKFINQLKRSRDEVSREFNMNDLFDQNSAPRVRSNPIDQPVFEEPEKQMTFDDAAEKPASSDVDKKEDKA